MQSIELDGPRIAPRIEYAAWVRRNSFADTFTHLLALRGALQSFYAAGLDAYRGEREAWSSEIRDALQAQPDNPYSADSSATTCSTGATSPINRAERDAGITRQQKRMFGWIE